MNTRTHLRTAWGVVRRLRTLAIIAVTMHFDYFYLHVYQHHFHILNILHVSFLFMKCSGGFTFFSILRHVLSSMLVLIGFLMNFFFPSYLRPSSCLLILSSFHGSSCPFSIFFCLYLFTFIFLLIYFILLH